MDKSAVLKIVGRFQSALEESGVPVDRIVLFGSYSKGTAHVDSDIDVLVVSSAFEGKDLWERIEVLTPALSALMEPIEAVACTEEEWERKDRAIVFHAREGEIIYAA